jgi:pyrroloquinoline quinone biosynthesis protein B
MIFAGVGTKLAREMGHLPQSGRGGMIDMLRCFPEQRKILIHINNTNPILDEDSPERAQLSKENIEVAYDGMEIGLDASESLLTDANVLAADIATKLENQRAGQ